MEVGAERGSSPQARLFATCHFDGSFGFEVALVVPNNPSATFPEHSPVDLEFLEKGRRHGKDVGPRFEVSGL